MGKLTAEAQQQIATMIRTGLPVEHAAKVAGIGERTFYLWMTRGALEGRANARYRAFRAAVEQARAENEAILASRVGKAAASGSWRAAAWLLERQYPENWASGRRGDGDGEPVKQPSPSARIRDELASRRAGRGERDGTP